MFNRIRKKIKVLIAILEDYEELVFEINSQDESKDLLVYLVTQKQLFEGLDGDGNEITPGYSEITVIIKQAKGQPTDRVTLKDTGEFYNSFDVVVTLDGVQMVADTIKGNNDLIKIYGEAITGISEESKKVYLEYFKDEFRNLLIKEIRAVKGINN